MRGLFFLFVLFALIFRDPIVALIVIAIVFYFVDRRFLGFLPNLLKPFQRQLRISQLERQILTNPHDAPARYDLAKYYIERKAYGRASRLLEALPDSMQDAPDVMCDRGVCQMHLGQMGDGEQRVIEALSIDSRLRYGDPYLQLATALETANPERALAYLRQFQDINASSCESDYRLAKLLQRFDDRAGAKAALRHCLQTYRGLPKFRKRRERRYATLARLKLLLG